MEHYTYSVSVNGELVAHGMTLDNAILLLRAEFLEYPEDTHREVTIHRDYEDRCKVIEDNELICDGRDVY